MVPQTISKAELTHILTLIEEWEATVEADTEGELLIASTTIDLMEVVKQFTKEKLKNG